MIVSILAFTAVGLFAVAYFPIKMMELRTNRGVVISNNERTISRRIYKTFIIAGFTVLVAGTIYANWGW